jgi:Cdc6-like AAA superfamily ATPase
MTIGFRLLLSELLLPGIPLLFFCPSQLKFKDPIFFQPYSADQILLILQARTNNTTTLFANNVLRHIANHASKNNGSVRFALEIVMKATNLCLDELRLKQTNLPVEAKAVVTVDHACKAIELSNPNLENIKAILHKLTMGLKSILCILVMIAKGGAKMRYKELQDYVSKRLRKTVSDSIDLRVSIRALRATGLLRSRHRKNHDDRSKDIIYLDLPLKEVVEVVHSELMGQSQYRSLLKAATKDITIVDCLD